MSFIHNVDPVLLNIGPIKIYYYSLVYIIGFIAIYLTLRYYSNKKIINLTKNDIENFSIYLILGIVIGARLFEVIVWNPIYYLTDPLKIFALWEGGMSLHGGIIGIALVGYFFCKKKKLNLAKMADLLTIPAVFVLALGRIANFINGELYGIITNVRWCVYFPKTQGCRHPVQLYGAFGRVLLGGFLLIINKKKRKNGFIFWTFLTLMGIGRFFADFLRQDLRFLGLSMGQYLSLIMAIAGAFILIKYYYKKF